MTGEGDYLAGVQQATTERVVLPQVFYISSRVAERLRYACISRQPVSHVNLLFHLLLGISLIESYDFRRGRLCDLDALIPSRAEKGLGKAGPRDLSALCVGDISLSSSECFDERSA